MFLFLFRSSVKLHLLAASASMHGLGSPIHYPSALDIIDGALLEISALVEMCASGFFWARDLMAMQTGNMALLAGNEAPGLSMAEPQASSQVGTHDTRRWGSARQEGRRAGGRPHEHEISLCRH